MQHTLMPQGKKLHTAALNIAVLTELYSLVEKISLNYYYLIIIDLKKRAI